MWHQAYLIRDKEKKEEEERRKAEEEKAKAAGKEPVVPQDQEIE